MGKIPLCGLCARKGMPLSLQRSYFVSKKALHVRLMDGDAGHQYSR